MTALNINGILARTSAVSLISLLANLVISSPAFAQADVTTVECEPESLETTGSGFGRCSYADASRYIGDYRNGQPNGRGIYTLEDGTRYEGQFVDGQPNGQGRLVLPNDARYEGRFENGTIAEGTAFFENGDRYTGNFAVVTRIEFITRTVTLTDPSTGLIRTFDEEIPVEISSSQPQGYDGVYNFVNGNRFVGEFFDGHPYGPGTFYHTTGTVCSGFYLTRNFDAREATCRYPDGRRYVGELRQGRPHGTGTMTLTDGTTIQGAFREGQPVSFSGFN